MGEDRDRHGEHRESQQNKLSAAAVDGRSGGIRNIHARLGGARGRLGGSVGGGGVVRVVAPLAVRGTAAAALVRGRSRGGRVGRARGNRRGRPGRRRVVA